MGIQSFGLLVILKIAKNVQNRQKERHATVALIYQYALKPEFKFI
jgi:hypothetical protein